jgi:hypothetical protein
LQQNFATGVSRLKVRDVGTGTVWDVSDAEYLKKIFSVVSDKKNYDKQTRDKVYEAFERNLERAYFDQTTDKDFEPLQIDRKEDLVTQGGLARLAALATNDSSQFFTHFASGIGRTQENRADTQLDSENARVGLGDSGYASGNGSSLKYAGFFPTGIASTNVTEGGVFDDGEGGLMLFRTVYSTSFAHVQYQTVYILTQSILLQSVQAE